MGVRVRAVRAWLHRQTLDDWKVLLGIAVGMGGLIWGMFTFYYKDVLMPSRQPTGLVVTPSMEDIGRRGDTVLIRASFMLENRTDARVYVPAIWYIIHGTKISTVDTLGSNFSQLSSAYAEYFTEFGDSANVSHGSTRYSQLEDHIIASGLLQPSGETWFEPAEERRVERFLAVPVNGYDLIRTDVQFFLTKDYKRLASVRWATDSTGYLNPSIDVKKYFLRLVPIGAEPFDGQRAHRRWQKKTAAGFAFVEASLPLRAPPAKDKAAGEAASP